jgi:hypothetical protein
MKQKLYASLFAVCIVTALSIALPFSEALRARTVSPTPSMQSTDRARLLDEIASLRNQLKAREQEYLSPTPQERDAFAQFLSQPATGLIRLMPRLDNESQSKLSIRGAGAYYSFTRLTHEYGYGSDIGLENGNFHVGFAGADYGFLATLGDLPLETVSTETSAVQYLISLASPTRMSEARAQQKLASEGTVHDGSVFKNRVGAVVGHSYVLRSVDTDTSDVLVAFRVVRRDDDGSLIILWKMLRQFPAPVLVRDAQ